MLIQESTDIKPFVKWAGGKKQLLPTLSQYIPSHYKRYLEPFVGGGALLFHLKPPIALINDSNDELMNCYRVIRDNVQDLIEDLKIHINSKDYFYDMRKQDVQELTIVERASRFIYLNRTCFNGLWRVNKKNQFNTPFGYHKNPKILNADLLLVVSEFLSNVELFESDFEVFLLENARKGDFIYLDPPYYPVSKYSDFKRYTKDFFGEPEQIRLANVFKKLDKKGCKLLLSNSHSDLISQEYDGYDQMVVEARRNINKDGNGRGAVKEYLVRNYE